MASQILPRHCKILCTLGPASNTPELVGALMDAGMNAVRLNLSHGTHEDHTRVYKTVRKEASRRGIAVAILADLQGPKIRVGTIPGDGFALERDQRVEIDVDPEAEPAPIEGGFRITTNYRHMVEDVRPGDRILLDDGHIELVVQGVEGSAVVTTVMRDTWLSWLTSDTVRLSML